MAMTNFEDFIRNVPNFPIEGIQYKDITTLLKSGSMFPAAIDAMCEPFKDRDITAIVGIESRGFIFGAAMSYKMGIGFVPVRKPGKLPAETMVEEYQLEYGTDSLEIHVDGLKQDDEVLIVDDVLATGGTAAATCRLIERLGANITAVSFLIELSFLNGREKLGDREVHSLISY